MQDFMKNRYEETLSRLRIASGESVEDTQIDDKEAFLEELDLFVEDQNLSVQIEMVQAEKELSTVILTS
jgi:hypothetical protein